MTSKDYIMIADYMRDSYVEVARTVGNAEWGWSAALGSLMEALEADNPRFNADRFMDYITRVSP